MSDKSNNKIECSVICWGIAALVGLVSMILLYTLADYSFIVSILIGVLIALFLGFALKLFVCRGFEDRNATMGSSALHGGTSGQGSVGNAATHGSSSAGAAAAASIPAAASTSASAAEPAAASTVAAPAAPEPVAAEPAAPAAAPASDPEPSAAAAASTPASLMGTGVKPSTPLAGEAELASRKGAWKYEAPAAEQAPAKKAPAKKAAAPKPAAEAPAATPVAAATSDGPITEGAPELFDAAPAGGADDLKLISGVGPKLEQTLNDMGIYVFSQVAVWGSKEIAWVDSRLRFKGRIERDDWMSQAKNLAAGGAPQAPKRKK